MPRVVVGIHIPHLESEVVMAKVVEMVWGRVSREWDQDLSMR
jgi:hypothetical protein